MQSRLHAASADGLCAARRIRLDYAKFFSWSRAAMREHSRPSYAHESCTTEQGSDNVGMSGGPTPPVGTTLTKTLTK